MGKLVEDVDALARTICCYQHCSINNGNTRPQLLVTASVDRIVLKRPIHVDTHLQIARAVTWVRCSSMAILSRLQALFAKGRVFCNMPALADRDSILIRDTCCENSLICHSQQRNIHGRVFGGF